MNRLFAILPLLCLPVAAQITNTPIRLGPLTTLVWNANPEPDVVSYNAYMRQGTNIWKYSTAETQARLVAINPAVTNGVYDLTVTAVNSAGLESDAGTVLTVSLAKPPVSVQGIKVEAPNIIRFEVKVE